MRGEIETTTTTTTTINAIGGGSECLRLTVGTLGCLLFEVRIAIAIAIARMRMRTRFSKSI